MGVFLWFSFFVWCSECQCCSAINQQDECREVVAITSHSHHPFPPSLFFIIQPLNDLTL